jgi:hypothetical protein
MGAKMFSLVARFEKPFITVRTLVWLLAAMSTAMNIERSSMRENLVTLIAFEFLVLISWVNFILTGFFLDLDFL